MRPKAILLRLPDRVNGIPVFREIRDLAPEMPVALFQEKEKPRFLPIVKFLQKAVQNYGAQLLLIKPAGIGVE
jgi:hypothetical protein